MSEPREELEWMAPKEVRRLENRRWYWPEVRRRAFPVLRRLLVWAVVLTVGFWAVIGTAVGDLDVLPAARRPGGLLGLEGGLGVMIVVSAPCFWLLWWMDERARFRSQLPPPGGELRWVEDGELRRVPLGRLTGAWVGPHPLDERFSMLFFRSARGWIPIPYRLPTDDRAVLEWADRHAPRLELAPGEPHPVERWLEIAYPSESRDEPLGARARWICLVASLTAAFALPGLLGWMRSMGAPAELMLLVVWCLFPATLLVPWLADGPVDDFRGRLRAMIGRHAEARANRTGARLRMEVFAYNGLSLAVGSVFILRRLAESIGAT